MWQSHKIIESRVAAADERGQRLYGNGQAQPNDAQPEKFNNLFQAMYWGVSTLAIGYGDIYPVTIGGKLTATVLAMLGIGLITIPSAILSAGFIEEIQNRKLKKTTFTPPPPPSYSGDNNREPSANARRHEVQQTDQTKEELEKLTEE